MHSVRGAEGGLTPISRRVLPRHRLHLVHQQVRQVDALPQRRQLAEQAHAVDAVLRHAGLQRCQHRVFRRAAAGRPQRLHAGAVAEERRRPICDRQQRNAWSLIVSSLFGLAGTQLYS